VTVTGKRRFFLHTKMGGNIQLSFQKLRLVDYDQNFATEKYDGVSKSFRTGRLERELQMEQLSSTRCSCIAIL
jgi:hypothetical protein